MVPTRLVRLASVRSSLWQPALLEANHLVKCQLRASEFYEALKG
jgi:hypothetical protein